VGAPFDFIAPLARRRRFLLAFLTGFLTLKPGAPAPTLDTPYELGLR